MSEEKFEINPFAIADWEWDQVEEPVDAFEYAKECIEQIKQTSAKRIRSHLDDEIIFQKKTKKSNMTSPIGRVIIKRDSVAFYNAIDMRDKVFEVTKEELPTASGSCEED